MKMKTVLVLAFAVGCGLIAMMGVQQMIAKQSNPNQDRPISVLVAKIDISPGVMIGPDNTEFRDLPAQGVPSDAVLSKEQYVDRGMRVPVLAGDIIRMSKLGARGEIAASASIPTGMRTVSIQVNDTKTHSGLLQPGDRVDLQVTYEARNPEGFRITKTAILLEYIEVFASDAFRNLEAGESKEIKAKNITLLVTPTQANMIQLANTKGELVPIMRSKTDKELTNNEGIDAIVVEELRTGMVHDGSTKPQTETSPAQPAAPIPAFREFLEQKIVEAPPEAEPLVNPKNSWVITIYAGDDVITQDVGLMAAKGGLEELPLPLLHEPMQTGTGTRVDKSLQVEVPVSPPTAAAGGTLKDFLDALLPGKKPAARPEPVQAEEPQEGDERTPVPHRASSI